MTDLNDRKILIINNIQVNITTLNSNWNFKKENPMLSCFRFVLYPLIDLQIEFIKWPIRIGAGEIQI